MTVDSHILAGPSHGLSPVPVQGFGGVSLPLLTRTPVLCDEGPTLITSHNLYYLLVGPPPHLRGRLWGQGHNAVCKSRQRDLEAEAPWEPVSGRQGERQCSEGDLG